MEFELGLLFLLAILASCAAIAGCVSYRKNDSPLRGCVLGGLLGPVGVALVLRRPFTHRPMVDQGAWSSFRSMVEHQSDCEVLQLAVTERRMPPPTARVSSQL